MTGANYEDQLRRYYTTLYQAWGAQHWWPAESRFEVIVGAYLTQNTAWTNVERALDKSSSGEGLLASMGFASVSSPETRATHSPVRIFSSKGETAEDFRRISGQPIRRLSRSPVFSAHRKSFVRNLLSLNGVGPETADSILLYAGNHPVFVVDAYTRRILERHGHLEDESRVRRDSRVFERALNRLQRIRVLYPTHPHLESGFAWSSPRSFRDEHHPANRTCAGLQRNARPDCRSGQEPLWEIPVRIVMAVLYSPFFPALSECVDDTIVMVRCPPVCSDCCSL